MPEAEFRTAYTRVDDIDEIKGKAIEYADTWDEKFGLRFADGTYLVIEAEQGWDVASLDFKPTIYEDDALRLGIIDAAEHARVKAAKEAAQEAREKARRDEVDRRAYLRALDMMLERGQIERTAYDRMKAEHERPAYVA